jgi:hypothetical protein
MKAWAVIGALMSLLASAPPEAGARLEPGSGGPLGGEPTGRSITGPGFYVWDEDAGEAEAWALELAEAWARAIVRGPQPEDDE